MIVANLSEWDQQKHRDDSRDLDELASGNYAPIKRAIDRDYSNTPAMQVRAIPFVERYVAELAGLYGRSLVRSWPGLSDAQARKLRAVYAASHFDGSMGEIECALWTQNTVLALVLPNGVGRVRVVPVMPWQVTDVVIDDPIAAHDPGTWSRLVCSVPASVNHGMVTFGDLRLTKSEAKRQIGGSWVGIYNEEGTNPFDGLPVVALHRTKPLPGRWAAPVNEAVLNLQISLSLQNSDNDLIVKECAWPQKVLEGATLRQQVETITLGPDKVLAIMRSGDPDAPSPSLKVVQGQVPVAELVSYAEHKIRLYCSLLGMDPSSFIRTNTAVTASARLFAAQDRAMHRNKLEPVLLRGETELAQLIAQVLAVRELVDFPRVFSARVRWAVMEPTADPAQAANARTANYEAGTSSPSRDVAREQGISLARARAVVDANLAESRELGIVAEPAPVDAPVDAPADAQGDAAPAEPAAQLNGAQVTAVLTVSQEVASGRMTPTAAFELIMMAFPTFDPVAVRRLIDAADAIELPAEAPAPTGGSDATA